MVFGPLLVSRHSLFISVSFPQGPPSFCPSLDPNSYTMKDLPARETIYSLPPSNQSLSPPLSPRSQFKSPSFLFLFPLPQTRYAAFFYRGNRDTTTSPPARTGTQNNRRTKGHPTQIPHTAPPLSSSLCLGVRILLFSEFFLWLLTQPTKLVGSGAARRICRQVGG